MRSKVIEIKDRRRSDIQSKPVSKFRRCKDLCGVPVDFCKAMRLSRGKMQQSMMEPILSVEPIEKA